MAVNSEQTMATDLDGVYDHLRKQDSDIDALRADVTKLRADMTPVIKVVRNFEGLSEFCVKWGGRISMLVKWLGPAGILWLGHLISETAFWQWLRAKF